MLERVDRTSLQEIIGAHASHPLRYPRWPDAAQYEFLADTIWPAHAYGRNAVYPEGHHGNALMSMFPIVSVRNHEIRHRRHETRGLLHCVIQWPGQTIHAICVHLSLRAAQRHEEVQRLCRLIDEEIPQQAPLIVAGDFNDWGFGAHRRLQGCSPLREVFIATQRRAARTYPARLPLLPLDRIYVRHLQVRKLAVLRTRPWSRLSDHAALYAELEA